MPASRWNSDLMELLSWFGEKEFQFNELFMQPVFTRVDTDSDDSDEAEEHQEEEAIPSTLPILPLRGCGLP